ncbi:MFS transporter [Luteococcus sp. Sow4_B9]|uniref:MFS transporter n=1 Tax=Luteococcus sp. Sow4_B9 TaxID=3438792 RepID=UPI003F960461
MTNHLAGSCAAADSTAATSPASVIDETPAPRPVVAAWSAYDFGGNAFNTVMLSFVFSVYVTGTVADDPARGQVVWSNFQTAAGIALALLAPLMGAWADRVRHRRVLLAVSTLITIACMAACFFVKPDDAYLLLGAGLLSFASVAQDIAGVFYNGMLPHVSTPKTVGRISGTAWALGYLGGVVCLVGALFGFILNGGMLGLPTDEAFNVRCVALFCALFMLVFSVPVMILGPDGEPRPGERFSVVGAYREIGSRIAHMWQRERGLLHFLVAAGIYRDGLNAVFAFAGVIAATAYGFSSEEVIYFGLAASVSAALGTWIFGRLDDKLGPRPVILGSLIAIVAEGLAIVIANQALVFWVCGMMISFLVGPIQSASRTLLTRIIPPGEENETFGLYATVGRVVSFIAPALIGVFTAAFGVRWGIMGIVVTLIFGLALFWPLRIPGVTHQRA